ncbi:hypothetical protein PSQ40_09620 [Curvibacter sp. HBC61]|uniref:Uncharacterized protein n=1 Tax=Curvibacter cyanobacteriorum TaxID=3026422 RepID=A0ABT5MXR1_9BURK|nr:hypothetical protein [Curvibacter sp. HBC61]MDD0838827.1 hypothetical protein [Curvibacter sp. HBC61]
MDLFLLALLGGIACHFFKAQEQRRRIALLGSVLGQYQIEKLMETLTEGYLRALGESDPARREQVWQVLTGCETSLSDQFNRFANEFARVDGALTRVSRLPLALPWADRLPQSLSFDLRELLKIHARGLAQSVQGGSAAAGLSPRDRAFQLSAELFLMQHSCHWYCKSKAVASARLLARHKTSHAQVLAAVSPETRQAYLALVGA